MNPDLSRFDIRPYTAEFFRTKTAPYLEGQNNYIHQSVGRFVQNMFLQFSQSAELYRKGKGLSPRLAVVFMGPPGNGKTFLINTSNRAVDEWAPQAYRDDLINRDGSVSKWFNVVPWEVAGLKAARLEGAITTPPHELANPTGLRRANELYESALAVSVRDSFITSAEEVDAAAIVVNKETNVFFDRYSGRAMGNDGGRNLFLRKGSFAGIGSEYNVLPYAIGVCAGPVLEVLAGHRFGVKNASNLAEARRISLMFGKTPPQSQDELVKIQTEGASERQMAGVYEALRDQIRFLKATERIIDPNDPYLKSDEANGGIWLPNKLIFDDYYNEAIKGKVGLRAKDRQFGAYIRYASGALLQYICEKDFGIPRGSSNYGIFFNNPDLEYVGIGKNQQRALRNYHRKIEMLTEVHGN